MFQTPEEVNKELEHLRSLLRTYTKNLHITEEQMATYGPSAMPLHLFHQQEWAEAERTKTLQKIQELEQRSGERLAAQRPEVNVHLLFKSLPTGILHLYSHDNLPLLKYDITNPTDMSMSVTVSSWVEQFSYTRSDTVRLSPGESRVVTQLPTLKSDAVADVYEVRKAVLHTRVSYLADDQESLLFVQDHDVQVLARDALIWAIIGDEDTVVDLSHHIVAWVMPNDRAIVDMLRHAADYSSTGELWGYQGSGTAKQRAALVRGQVKAIFRALKEKGQITYINAPISFGQRANEVQQRVNLPKDSLAYRQANCIDGAVLYASLIERAAMNPVMVIIPGHAFVGWETWDGSKQYEFLETTMTGKHTFEQASKKGMEEFKAVESWIGRRLFDPQGFAVLLDVRALHERGILPAG